MSGCSTTTGRWRPGVNNPYLAAHIDRHGPLCTGPNGSSPPFNAGNQGKNRGEPVFAYMRGQIENRFLEQQVQSYLPYTGTYFRQGLITCSFVCPLR